MSLAATILTGLSLAIWLVMIFGRGMFWLTRERDNGPPPAEPAIWPPVAVVVPARDEADVIASSIGSLLAQDYPGPFRVILVDDGSSDGSGAIAAETAARRGLGDRLTVRTGAPLEAGWTGKLWAMKQGVEVASEDQPPPKYLLLTDADIAHSPDNLRRLVARAEAGGLVLTSLMARLSCVTWPEKLMIPAFVYFFAMVYPFAQVNDPRSRVAGAAGGCMLARADALRAAGGIAAIRTAIIDDCALGAAMKQQGPIWLGLTDRAQSQRPYVTLSEIGRMISRSAYAQLNYSPLILIGAVAGVGATYLAPPLAAVFAPGALKLLGVVAWALMAVSFWPMLKFYRRSLLWGLALPLIGAIYTVYTVKSAVDVWMGRGGFWKGRAQAQAGRA